MAHAVQPANNPGGVPTTGTLRPVAVAHACPFARRGRCVTHAARGGATPRARLAHSSTHLPAARPLLVLGPKKERKKREALRVFNQNKTERVHPQLASLQGLLATNSATANRFVHTPTADISLAITARFPLIIMQT